MAELEVVKIVVDSGASPRVEYGASRLAEALRAVGVGSEIRRVGGSAVARPGGTPVPRVSVTVEPGKTQSRREGFRIRSTVGEVSVVGGDDSGAMYGCLELARRVRELGGLPEKIDVSDGPVFVLRGPCIGMQKTFILPGRRVYEYPYTPELFPFFYDQGFWREYLDFLAEHRFNSLYLWNGHPFASLVKVKEYPYAMEVTEEVFAKNVEMFRYITGECDRRGIWLVQNFYSIILSKPFAEHHGLATQLSAPTPEAADYMRKAVAEFIRQYPNVGLMICLGEALRGLENQSYWCNEVILAGIKDGMRAAGLTEEPPVVLRTHATDARVIVPKALEVYGNLYTEAKFNGESLTTHEPRGVRQALHLEMSKLGSTHVSNVHILANLEPFRYGAQRFIKKCMQASRDRLGARGLHLYPLAFWDWPYAPDRAEPLLRQMDRDWIWFEAWGRYAWKADVPEAEDRAYWIGRLADRYGSREAAEGILDAYNDAGECAPRILRRFGITEGNRQTMSLGMTLDQLVNPEKYRAYEELWESQSPPGERLGEYVEREVKGEKHEGETPPQIIEESLAFSERAVEAIERAAGHVRKEREEFERLRNDIHCIRAMSRCYAAKVKAAMCVLRHKHVQHASEMERAEGYLAESLEHYRELARLTKDTYRYANTMQTGQRKIPVSGGAGGKAVSYHWTQLVGVYESELADFRRKVAALKEGWDPEADESKIERLPKGRIRIVSGNAETYEVQVGAIVFTDRPAVIQSLAPELAGINGIRFSHEAAARGELGAIEFEAEEGVQVLVGYFKGAGGGGERGSLTRGETGGGQWLRVPDLETDAMAAEHIDVEPLIQNAAAIEGLPPVDVHAFRYGAGRHRLDLRGTGVFVVLGIVPESAEVRRRDARRGV
jgi:hypothetical protein